MKKIIFIIFLSRLLFAEDDFKSLVIKINNNNPSVLMGNREIKSSEFAVESAMWEYYPTPSVDVSRSDKGTKTTAKLEQPIWTGGKLDSNYKQKISNKDEAFYTLEEKKYKLIKLMLDYSQTYVQAKYTNIALTEGLDRLNEFTSMIDRKIALGLASKSDKRLLESRLTQIKSDLINSEHKQRTSMKQLSILVGENLNDINFEDVVELKGLRGEYLQTKVIEFNPSLYVFKQKIKTAIYEIEKQEARIYPNLSVIGEYSKGNLYEDTDEENTAIYLNLRSDLGAGLSVLSNIKQAKTDVEKIEFEMKTVENDSIDSFWQDYNNYIVSKNKIDNYKLNKDSATDVFESNKRLFLADKKQWLDLVNSSKEVMDIDVALAESKAVFVFSKYKIALQSGLINLDNGSYVQLDNKELKNIFNINN